jgi:hypothetical protein
MGYFGHKLKDNDTFLDVYDEYIDKFKDNVPLDSILDQLKSELPDYLDDHEFWFATALGQWETNSLDKEVFKKVSEIISSGDNINIWLKSGADPDTLVKRQKVLIDFLVKISSPNLKPKTRMTIKSKQDIEPKLKNGDCLTFKLKNGNYGGAIVLHSQINEDGLNFIGILDINKTSKPELIDFSSANLISSDYFKGELVFAFGAKNYSKDKSLFEITHSELNSKYSPTKKEYDFGYFWSNIVDYANNALLK